MSIVRSAARTRMDALCGASATMTDAGMTAAQKDDVLHEATQFYAAHMPGIPLLGPGDTSVQDFEAAAASKRTTISDAWAGYGNVYLREIQSVHRTNAITGLPMERISQSEIVYLQNVVGETGTPTHFAIENGALTALGSASPDWNIYFYPIPSALFAFSFVGAYYPYKLTADSNTLKFPDEDGWAICRLGAAIMAGMLQRNQALIDELWKPFPEHWRAAYEARKLGGAFA